MDATSIPLRGACQEVLLILIFYLRFVRDNNTAAITKRNARYRDLTFGQPYVVIGIEADEFHILNDEGRPFLYPPTLFSVLDNREPADWVTEIGDDGERYSYPPPLNKPGFFEDFFDQKTKAATTSGEL
jgi:hypothetical protein